MATQFRDLGANLTLNARTTTPLANERCAKAAVQLQAAPTCFVHIGGRGETVRAVKRLVREGVAEGPQRLR